MPAARTASAGGSHGHHEHPHHHHGRGTKHGDAHKHQRDDDDELITGGGESFGISADASQELDDDEDNAEAEDAAPRARTAGIGPGGEPGDHPDYPRSGDDGSKRKGNTRSSKAKSSGNGGDKGSADPRIKALEKWIGEIYNQKTAGITEAQIKGEAQTVRSTLVIDSLKSLASLAVAALNPEFQLLGKALIEGFHAAGKKLLSQVDSDARYGFFSFCQDYIAAIPEAKDKAIQKAKHELRAQPRARIATQARDTATTKGTQLQNDQALEIVTAWTNALRKAGTNPEGFGGVGGARPDDKHPFDNAAKGHMHIASIVINQDWSLDPAAAKVTMQGVPGHAAEFTLDRTLGELKFARTLDFRQERVLKTRHGSFGVGPNHTYPALDGIDPTSKAVFASWDKKIVYDPENPETPDDGDAIKQHWVSGKNDLWDKLKGRKVRDFDTKIGQ